MARPARNTPGRQASTWSPSAPSSASPTSSPWPPASSPPADASPSSSAPHSPSKPTSLCPPSLGAHLCLFPCPSRAPSSSVAHLPRLGRETDDAARHGGNQTSNQVGGSAILAINTASNAMALPAWAATKWETCAVPPLPRSILVVIKNRVFHSVPSGTLLHFAWFPPQGDECQNGKTFLQEHFALSGGPGSSGSDSRTKSRAKCSAR